MMTIARMALAVCGFVAALQTAAQNPVPVLPNVAYPSDQVGSTLATISSRYGFSQVAMHRGHLVAITAQDGGGGFGRILLLDISNPTTPRIVRDDYFAESNEIREAHGWGFRGDTIVLQAQSGIMFWSLSPSVVTRRISYLKLPDVNNNDYNNAIWWTHWQGRYLYAGGTDNGLYIVDALDPVNPVFVKKVPISQLGGFRVGATHAIGNLLFITGFDNGPSGISALDISDPVNPRLLATTREVSSYASMLNGNKLVLGARNRPANSVVIYDVSDPTRLTRVGNQALTDSGGGGYVNFSDGYVFVGGVGGVKKVDLGKPGFPVVARFTAGQVDEGFPTPLGNLLFAGNDHSDYVGHGSGLIVHQAGPDTLGPLVNMVVPAAGATRQAITSRIGLSFSDQIEGQSLTPQNIVVREVGGDTVRGLIAHQTAIVNFHPLSLLKANTEYEVLVRAGGVRDYAGNPSPTAFRSTFMTGDRSDCRLKGPNNSFVGDTITLALTCTLPVTARITWELGDGTVLPYAAGQDTVRHAYVRRGAYSVFARIEGELLSGSALLHTTLHRPQPVRATSSSTIFLDAARGRLWNVNADNNSVTVSTLSTRMRLREIPVGRHPRTLAQDGQGRVWVVNQDDATVSVLDPDDFSLVAKLVLPQHSRPYGIVFASDGVTGYISLETSGSVVRVSATSRSITGELPVFPSSARGLAVTGDGARLYVSRYLTRGDQGQVAEVGTAPFALLRTVGLPYDNSGDTESGGGGSPNALAAVAITPDGQYAWVPFKKDNIRRGLLSTETGRTGRLTFENTVRTAVGQIRVETGLEDLSLRVDLDNRSLANAVAFTRAGSLAFVTTGASNHTIVLSGATGHPITAVVPETSSAELAPDGLVLSPNDSLLYVHYYLSRQIGVYDVSGAGVTNQLPLLGSIATVEVERLKPQVLRGKQIFYNASDSRMAKDRYMSCVVCHLDGGGTDGRVWDFTHKGEGLRRTPSLRGKAGLGQGPLHWSANFDEVQDFEHDMRADFGGSGFLSDEVFNAAGRNISLGGPKAGASAELDALAEYVKSLGEVRESPFRAADGTLTADARAGEVIFNRSDVGCAVCHVPPRYTNSGDVGQGRLAYAKVPAQPSVLLSASLLTQEGFLLHDVGTLKSTSGQRLGATLRGLDTPTLLGVWEGGPYLHDGSAATLMDVITTRNVEDLHGRTQHLTQLEKEQLVAFMMQLDQRDTPYTVNVRRSLTGRGAALLSVAQTSDHVDFSWPGALPAATLDIFDARGVRVARLTPHSNPLAAKTLFRWAPRTHSGSLVLGGIYFAQLASGGLKHSQRFTLVR